jgi:Skp family chaperone for outer membrane proteins
MKNMKRFTKTVPLIVCMMGFGGMAFAQQCKVAVVNMQEAITGSNEGKAQSGKFDARVREWKNKIDVIQREIDNARRQLQGQSGRPNTADINELNKTIVEKTRELAQTTGDAQKDVDVYRDSLLAPVQKSATEIAKAVATERGIDSVVDSSSPTTSSFQIPAGGNCDITSEVKTRMNAKFTTLADPAK